MRQMILILTTMSLFACQQSQKQKEADLKDKVHPVLTKYIASMKFGNIDSLDIYKIDSLNSKKVNYIKAQQYLYSYQELNDEFEKVLEDGKFNKRMLEIAYDRYNANELADKREKAQKIADRMAALDSLKILSLQMADTATAKDFLGYVVHFNLKYSDSVTLVQKSIDSGEVVMTKDFKIKEKNDFIK